LHPVEAAAWHSQKKKATGIAGTMEEPDITIEFAEWAKRHQQTVDDNNYYDLWARFIDEEYNDQREHPERYPA
jgi:hypothetical protein